MTVEEALTIVETRLNPQSLSKVQHLVFSQCWQGYTYADIAANYGYDTNYIKYVGFQLWQLLSQALGKKVTKSNIASILKAIASPAVGADLYISNSSNFDNGMMQFESFSTDTDAVAQKAATINQHPGWAEAMDVPVFYNRCTEILTMKQWLVQERCRLVAIFGIGGIGKTSLAAILAQHVQHDFQHLIWRSLRNFQPLTNMVAELFQTLPHQEKQLPTTPEASISLLVNYLRSSRCFLVLDNSEGILRSGDHFGRYREGYEHYGQLLREIADTYHQSCVVLTGREKPIGFGFKEGTNLPVRSLQLTGLSEEDAYKVIEAKGLRGSQAEMRSLIQHYLGNPLALKIVSAYIQDLFNGNISEFFAQGTTVFGDIRNLLDQQFNRLSEIETQIMYWLAINTELSIVQLQEELIPITSKANLLEALLSLERRSLIEKATPILIENNATRFSVPPIFKEYLGIVFQTQIL